MRKVDHLSPMIALLGRRDKPTDALEDYCECLGRALESHGYRLHLGRVPWAQLGWLRALCWLWRESAGWRDLWVLVQYSALQWSRRGFPVGLLFVLFILRCRGVRVVTVLHDPRTFRARSQASFFRRVLDWTRRRVQSQVLKMTCQLSEHCASTLPPECVPWMASCDGTFFLPVGPNVMPPEPWETSIVRKRRPSDHSGGDYRVAVFGVAGGARMQEEVRAIAEAISTALRKVPRLHLVVVGRGAQEAETALRQRLDHTRVLLSVKGVVPAQDVVQTFLGADVQVCVHGGISSRRGSAIAGIACGLPIIAYRNEDTTFPATEAGVVLVPEGDTKALGDALGSVLIDGLLRQELAARSLAVYRQWFSWESIATRLISSLGVEPEEHHDLQEPVGKRVFLYDD